MGSPQLSYPRSSVGSVPNRSAGPTTRLGRGRRKESSGLTLTILTIAGLVLMALPGAAFAQDGPCADADGPEAGPSFQKTAKDVAPPLRDLCVTTLNADDGSGNIELAAPSAPAPTVAGGPVARPEDVTTPTLPNRIETEAAVLLGDSEATIEVLRLYGQAFERHILPEVLRDLGLQPTSDKPAVQIYKTDAAWRADIPEPRQNAAGFTSGNRIFMKVRPALNPVNEGLLSHEYVHWLIHNEARAQVPMWFDEGLAFAISWRISDGSNDWSPTYPRLASRWASLTIGKPSPSVPILYALPDYSGDALNFITTATGYLVQTRGREALARFLVLSRQGRPFDDAFGEAFGSTPTMFQDEYSQEVAKRWAAVPTPSRTTLSILGVTRVPPSSIDLTVQYERINACGTNVSVAAEVLRNGVLLGGFGYKRAAAPFLDGTTTVRVIYNNAPVPSKSDQIRVSLWCNDSREKLYSQTFPLPMDWATS